METFLAQVAAAARKASEGYCTQGKPPLQEKNTPAGCPMKKGVSRQRSPSVPAKNTAINGNEEHNTQENKALKRNEGT
jgi:hypothetical protein